MSVVAFDLASLKAADVADVSKIFDSAIFTWTTGDFTAKINDYPGEYVESDHVPANQGAWMRQTAESIQIMRPGSGAIARRVQDLLQELPVTPEDFGAVGDGVADDTSALQAALDTGRSVRFAQGRTYLVKSKMTLSSSGVALTGRGTIKVASDFSFAADTDGSGTHMRTLFVTGSNVTIEGVMFDATDAPIGSATENGFIWSTAPYTVVRDCQFVGNPKGTCIWALGLAPYLSVSGCQFTDCSGAVFTKGRNSIISDNIIINATDAAIAINGTTCVGTVVSDNSISNENLAAVPSMIAVEEGASNWTIIGNTLTGVSGGGIICTNVLVFTVVDGGTIAGNVVDGARFDGTIPSSINPAALVAISGNYEGCIVTGNKVRNCPSGNSNSRLAIIPATGTIFADNILDGANTAGFSALINITPGNDGILIDSNSTTAAAGGRHYLFFAGDYNNVPCIFSGGSFYGGTVGIDSEMKAGSISNLSLNIVNITHVTATNVVNAATAIGDRASFLNAGAWARPHRIGVFTEMHCNAVPASAGAIAYQPGDKFYYMSPVIGNYIGVVRVPGSWRSFGAVI
jgi:hypothetical protein